MNKAFFANRFPQFNGRKDLYVEACNSDPDIKGDLCMMVENLVAMRRSANQHGTLQISWRPPPVRLTKRSSTSLIMRRPMRDLIPLDTFASWFDGASPADYGFPIATIYGDKGEVALQGILVRATEVNNPEGTVRLIADIIYAFEKTQVIADSSDDLAKGATDELWGKTCTDFEAAMKHSQKALSDVSEEVSSKLLIQNGGVAGQGVFQSVESLKAFINEKQLEQNSTAAAATTVDGVPPVAPILAKRAAEQEDFTCGLLDDETQVGTMFAAAAKISKAKKCLWEQRCSMPQSSHHPMQHNSPARPV